VKESLLAFPEMERAPCLYGAPSIGRNARTVNNLSIGKTLFRLPALAIIPVIDIRPHTVLLDTVAFLNLSFELIPLARDLIKIVVCELTPLLFDLALNLLPVTFDAIPVHCVVSSLLSKDNAPHLYWFERRHHAVGWRPVGGLCRATSCAGVR